MQFRADGFRGQCALSGDEALEHRLRRRNMMREAVSLMGGYGITEDCPGFLGHKWMDAQLEATYEGPEAVQRRQLSVTMTNRGVPGAVPQLDSRDARDCGDASRHAARARWLRRCCCGCGRSIICSIQRTPTGRSCIRVRGRA